MIGQGEKGTHCWLGWGHEKGLGSGESHSQFSNILLQSQTWL